MFDTRNRELNESANQKPDDYTYRSVHLSLWQSAASAVAMNMSRALLQANGQTVAGLAGKLMAPVHAVNRAASAGKYSRARMQLATPDFSALSTVSDCASLAARLLWADLTGDDEASQTLQSEFRYSECDVAGWLECATEYAAYKLSLGGNPYRPNLDVVRPMSDSCKIAIIGDWGTGDDIAVNVLQQVDALQPDILIHLGDIYYAGTQNEVTHNFLQICRATLGADVPLYSLCGNHDMYSGGKAYYGLLDTIGQQSSYFCLRGPAWQIIAIDTGNNDRNPFTVNTNMTFLNDSEIPWVQDKIKNPGGRKTILLSHHQLFSSFGSVGSLAGADYCYNPNLYSVFKDVLGSVDAWFWGHEHTLAAFDPYAGLNRGRCVGCSAIPVFRTQQSYQAATGLQSYGGKLPTWQQNVQLGNNGTDYNHAFAILTLHGPTADIEYYEVPVGSRNANPLASEQIP